MNIILASEVIHPGGAETFILRLSQALHNSGHNVHVFVFYSELLNNDLCKLLAPGVTIVPAAIPASKMLRKIDSLFFRFKIDVGLRKFFIKKSLLQLIASHKTQVIHSHLLKVDELCLEVAGPQNIPVVNTVHGDYLQFFDKTARHIAIPLLNYHRKASSNLKQLSSVVCISDKQIVFFSQHFGNETKGKTVKIYNGYTGTVTNERNRVRESLGISQDEFVYGMVSRGIPEKGWQSAINAFIELNAPGSHLVLVGSSDYLSSLKQQYKDSKIIHFTGHADNPVNWINIFDVGLLPSTYPSESLPTVIIEYLYCNVPVIASNAGEIVNMTGQGSTPAGQIVTIADGKINDGELANAMKEYLYNKALYAQHKANAAACYEMFDMDKCVSAYSNIYSKASQQTKQD